MTLDEFKAAINNTVKKIILGIKQHPKASAEQKKLDIQLFSTLQESIPSITTLPQIMKFYRTLFIYLEKLGKWADAASKKRIADGAVAKIKALCENINEYIDRSLNDVNNELLMADQQPCYFRGLCYDLHKFFIDKIAVNDRISAYQLTLWLIKSKPELVKTMLIYKKEIIGFERAGNEAAKGKPTQELSALVQEVKSEAQDRINGVVSRDYVISRFFSQPNNNVQAPFNLTAEETKQVDFIAPIFLQ